MRTFDHEPTLDIVDEERLRWKKIKGVFTPGGDPCYICPVCEDKESEHINGIEIRHEWNYCPICGTKLSY